MYALTERHRSFKLLVLRTNQIEEHNRYSYGKQNLLLRSPSKHKIKSSRPGEMIQLKFAHNSLEDPLPEIAGSTTQQILVSFSIIGEPTIRTPVRKPISHCLY